MKLFLRNLTNFLSKLFIYLSSIVVILPLLVIIFYLVKEGSQWISIDFFTQMPKPVGEMGGGMANAFFGSGVLLLISSLIGIPWGISVGIYLSERPKSILSKFARFATDLLLSTPSIVIGLFTYVVVVKPSGGFSAFAGGIALAIIMIPMITRSTEELLKLTPNYIKEAGLALGISRWKMIMFIVVRGSLGGIITTVSLSLSRVLGETAPLLFTSFSNQFWNTDLTQPMASMTMQIFTFAISPFKEWQQQAWTGALVLITLIFTVNLIVRFLHARKFQ